MADVLLGRSDGIEGFVRHVVLKRIRAEHARDERFVRMFLDEARVAATLHHQHIVQVHDIGQAEGEYFFAMEYIHGEDVRTILSASAKARAHIPLGHAVAIVSAAAGGLHYAHEKTGNDKLPLGIVHRDVSPSNILVGYDGSIKVVDFGVAKASMSQETRSGSLKGKISYMSPEQCRGTMVDRRSDVFALGVVLYELATTTRLFKGDNDFLVMEQIVTGKITPPKLRRPSLPQELSNIIMRALATDRDRRYSTADELRIALDQFATNTGLTASTSTIAAYMRKQFGERPEPWLDLELPRMGSLEDLPTAAVEDGSNLSWVEMPRVDASDFRSTPIPRISQPIPVTVANEIGRGVAASAAVQSSAIVPLPTQALPTESKLGWESQQRPPSKRSFTLPIAAACAAVILSVAIWRLSGPGSTAAPIAAIQPIAQPEPAPAPSAQPSSDDEPSAEPPRIIDMAVTRPAAETPAVAEPAAAARKVRIPPPAAAISRTPITPPIEAPPPPRSTKPERPSPMVVASVPAPSRAVEPGPAASDPRREVPAPPPPAPAERVTAPAREPAAPLVASAVPQGVTATALDANRIAGNKQIVPDNHTMIEISRSGEDKLIGIYKLCIGADGNVTRVSQLKGTGFPEYDAKILNTIKKEWRYRPFLINGRAAEVCTAARFIYSQK